MTGIEAGIGSWEWGREAGTRDSGLGVGRSKPCVTWMHPCGGQPPRPTPSPESPVPAFSARRVHQHVLEERLHRRLRTLVGEVPGVLHHGLDLVVELPDLVLADLAVLLHVR